MSATASIRELRDNLAEVVDRAAHEDEPTVITRNGREVAAVVSIDTLREWERWEEQRWIKILDERMADDDGTRIPHSEVLREFGLSE